MTSLKFPLIGTYRRVRGFIDHKRANPGTWYGIDYGCKVGTKCVANRSGAVNKVAYDKYSGNNIILQYRDFKGKLINLYAWYAHLSKVYVKAHQKFKSGQVIGLSGATGRVTGPHLHFSILKKRLWWFIPIDPEDKKTFKWTR